jgi:hypothetical protein
VVVVEEMAGNAAIEVGLGGATVVGEVVVVVGTLVVVLAVVGAIVIVPLFVVGGVLLRRVRS